MTREIVDSNRPADDLVRVFCHDAADALGRCKRYEITTPEGSKILDIVFHGDTAAAGVTNEALLLVVVDRLRIWSETGKTNQRIYEARQHANIALALLREDFPEPWAPEYGGTV
jgi:hypothetical protein